MHIAYVPLMLLNFRSPVRPILCCLTQKWPIYRVCFFLALSLQNLYHIVRILCCLHRAQRRGRIASLLLHHPGQREIRAQPLGSWSELSESCADIKDQRSICKILARRVQGTPSRRVQIKRDGMGDWRVGRVHQKGNWLEHSRVSYSWTFAFLLPNSYRPSSFQDMQQRCNENSSQVWVLTRYVLFVKYCHFTKCQLCYMYDLSEFRKYRILPDHDSTKARGSTTGKGVFQKVQVSVLCK